MKTVKANVWGEQTDVLLGTWEEIKALGFKKRDRNFGQLNDGTQALYFYKYCLGRDPIEFGYEWILTTEKLENIND